MATIKSIINDISTLSQKDINELKNRLATLPFLS